MGIESNKEAYQMVKNTLGSIENRFREAYNKGYKDGLRDGASQVTAKLVSKILEETEADTPQTDCDTCRHYKLACELFSEVCKYEPTTQTETQNSNLTFDTPQTERMTEEEIDTMLAKVLVGQTDSNCSELPNDSTDCSWRRV